MAGHGHELSGEPGAYGDADAGFTLDFLGNVGSSLVYNDVPGSSTFHGAGGSSSHPNPDEQLGRLDLNGGFSGFYQQYADHIQGAQDGLPPVRVPRGGVSRSLSFRPPTHGELGGGAAGGAFDVPAAPLGAGWVSPPPRPASDSIRRRGRRPRARGPGPVIHGDNFDASYSVPHPVHKHKANWLPENIQKFCDCYLAEIHAGNCPGGQLNKFGWKNVARRYYLASGLMHDREQLQGKLRTLRKIWTLCDKAQNHTGLGIDAEGKIHASDKWWNDNAQGDHDLLKIRRDGVPAYLDQLHGMFKGNTVDGSTSFVPAARETIDLNEDDSDEEAGQEHEDGLTPMSIGNKRTSSTSTTASSPSKRSKSPAVRSMSIQMNTHNDLSRERLQFMKERESRKEQVMQILVKDKSWKITECTRIALQELGISTTTKTLFSGLHQLVQSETEMDFFLAQDSKEGKLHVIELNIPKTGPVDN